MGDRGNIVIFEEGGGTLYFYSHWRGTELPQILQAALKRGKDRWDDESYLARIIFCEMTKYDVDGLLGYGISTDRRDWNHPNLEVHMKEQKIVCGNQSCSFQEFIEVGFKR